MKSSSKVLSRAPLLLCSIGLLVSVLAPRAFASRVLDRTAVTVNDEVILDSDIDKFQQKLKSKSFQELFGGVDPKMLDNRAAVTELLIEEKLINQQVKKLELQANDAEIDGNIKAIEARNGITDDQLRQRLSQLNTTMAEYRDGIRRQIERHNLLEREILPSLEVTDEDLRHYYVRHVDPNDEKSQQYKISHILLAYRAKGPAAIDDAKQRAKQVWKEVSQHPDNWDEYVKNYSDDSDTRNSGGSLGDFNLSSLAEEFREAVKKTPVGQITKPIKMADGFHILKVVEKKAQDFNSLTKEQKDELRNQMKMSETEREMQLWLQRKKREANIQRFGQNDANE